MLNNKKHSIDDTFISIENRKYHIKKILMLKARINYTTIYFIDGNSITLPITMGVLEKYLTPPSFFRTHRSTLVNLEYLASIDYKFKTGKASTIDLYNGIKIPLSRRRTAEFSKIIYAQVP